MLEAIDQYETKRSGKPQKRRLSHIGSLVPESKPLPEPKKPERTIYNPPPRTFNSPAAINMWKEYQENYESGKWKGGVDKFRERLVGYRASLVLGRDFQEDTDAFYKRTGIKEFDDWAASEVKRIDASKTAKVSIQETANQNEKEGSGQQQAKEYVEWEQWKKEVSKPTSQQWNELSLEKRKVALARLSFKEDLASHSFSELPDVAQKALHSVTSGEMARKEMEQAQEHEAKIMKEYSESPTILGWKEYHDAKSTPRLALPSPTTQIQPETVKTNSIPESPFTRFKKYGIVGVQGYEVSEQDYIDHQILKEKARLAGNIANYQEVIGNINNPQFLEERGLYIGPRSKQKKIEEYQFYIESWKRRLARLDTSEGKAQLEHSHKNNYIELVKASIKHGEQVPDEVIEQRPEFQVAKDARRRYEKGLHTSFANKSAAVNAVMFHEKGYKIKRQDGKQILDSQISEIDRGISEVQEATGPTKDIMQKSDLTIAHTSGTFPFLNSTSLGIYHPAENTITTGVQIDFLGKKSELRSLAHEYGHWLDYQAGGENKKGYEFYTNGKSSRRVKSYRSALSTTDSYSNPLYQTAQYRMNNSRAVRLAQNPSELGRPMTDEEKAQAKEWTARIGSYYRDPREMWARMVEQYVSEQHGKATTAAESPEYYHKHPAYWSQETFNEMKPTIKAEIERRQSIARGT